MKFCATAAIIAVVLGVVAPVSSAMAYHLYDAHAERYAPASPYDGRIKRGPSVHDSRTFTRCPMSSASEGNANQQNFPVKQYGETSGGYRC